MHRIPNQSTPWSEPGRASFQEPAPRPTSYRPHIEANGSVAFGVSPFGRVGSEFSSQTLMEASSIPTRRMEQGSKGVKITRELGFSTEGLRSAYDVRAFIREAQRGALPPIEVKSLAKFYLNGLEHAIFPPKAGELKDELKTSLTQLLVQS